MDQFDSLLEESPFVQKKSAEAEEKGRAEGLAVGLAEGRAEGLAAGIVKGKAIALQEVVIKIVRGRFPALTELAQEQATRINKPDVLDFLFDKVITAPDEAMLRWLLSSLAA